MRMWSGFSKLSEKAKIAAVNEKSGRKIGNVKEKHYFCIRKSKGEVLEWLKRHAWKACNRRNRFAGSNPVLSADCSSESVGHHMISMNLFFTFTPKVTRMVFCRKGGTLNFRNGVSKI